MEGLGREKARWRDGNQPLFESKDHQTKKRQFERTSTKRPPTMATIVTGSRIRSAEPMIAKVNA